MRSGRVGLLIYLFVYLQIFLLTNFSLTLTFISPERDLNLLHTQDTLTTQSIKYPQKKRTGDRSVIAKEEGCGFVGLFFLTVIHIFSKHVTGADNHR